MPLLISPIDGSPMRQVVRNGVEIDVCPTSGGIWLDRGELEKLLALVTDAVNDDYRPSRGRAHELEEFHQQHQGRKPPFGYHDDDDDDDYRRRTHRKGKLHSILSMFD